VKNQHKLLFTIIFLFIYYNQGRIQDLSEGGGGQDFLGKKIAPEAKFFF